MSAQAIARWNAIPATREGNEEAYDAIRGVKRTRNDEHSDSDGDVSIVSRTPSPPPPDEMEIDQYDEYHSALPRETITVETRIKNTNKGFAMLAKLGWAEGMPLGVSGEGRVDPVPFYVKNDLTGLGKMSQDVEMIESTVSQRRNLDSERHLRETQEQRREREDTVARREDIKTELASTLRPFYCDVCDKQFQNVAQYDEHTNSYAHHHKIRFRDMQATQRTQAAAQGAVDARREKERKREEKELKKLAKAHGIKIAAHTIPNATASSSTASIAPAEKPKAGSGWAAVSAPAAPVPPRWSSAVTPDAQSAPAFRTGGWSSLDDPATQAHGPTAVIHAPSPPSGGEDSRLPLLTGPNSAVRGAERSDAKLATGSANMSLAAPVPVGGFRSLTAPTSSTGASLTSDASSTALHSVNPILGIVPATSSGSTPALDPYDAAAKKTGNGKKKAKKEEAAIREQSRSGWQSFQRGGKR
ncbi:unnamed protein product [Peniophora sp. CBMAI 1063]|nr:unnamed protein product [Peniophora sp. CBMAI 1063]